MIEYLKDHKIGTGLDLTPIFLIPCRSDDIFKIFRSRYR